MPELPRQSSKHLARAEALTRPLMVEEATLNGPDATSMIQADQGQALRRLLYECTAAIVAAIETPHG